MSRKMDQAGIRPAGRLATVAWIVAVGLTALSATAGITRNWVGGSGGTWDDANAANWSPSGVPTNTDVVNIDLPGGNTAYTAANLSGSGLDTCNIMNSGAGTNVFTLDGNDYLPVRLVLSIGRWSTNACTFNLTGSALLTLYGGGSGLILGGSGGAGPFVFNQSGGVFSNGVGAGSLVYIYSNATYNLSGGSYIANRDLALHGGTFRLSGGTVVHAFGMTLNPYSTFEMTSGSYTHGGSDTTLGTNATARWLSGAPAGQLGRVKLLGQGAAWIMKGGTLTVNRSGTSSASKDSLYLCPDSTVRGYGTIQDMQFGASSPATFDHNGRVVADGDGEERALNVSRFGATLVTNSTDNTASNGWFAVGRGALLLPAVSVGAGSVTTNWGEAAADTTIDLVNSARIAFTGASAGSLTGALYAVDATNVPVGLAKPISVWSFGGVACASVALTFRYDDAAAAALYISGTDLRVWRHNGVRWVDVTESRDGSARTITTQPVGSLATTTFFAVGGVRSGTVVTIR